ncbi:TPA: glycosyltransferase family 1 protein [Candidatus Poribacteria bacterium]|nr:glycosyltransferase family 1 protein [Candidatus Poribacteria bacterium]
MRILVISHSAIQPTYHRKFEEISKLGDVSIRVIVPEKWVENTQVLHFSKIDKPNLTFIPAKVTFPGYGSRFFFISNIAKHFYEFKPNIIHLEEEPWSLCAIQTIILRKILCPKSPLIFRTSLSIPIKQRFNFLAESIEKITFRESDFAFILSEKAGKILRQKGYKKDMKVSPNGVDSAVFRRIDVSELKQKLGITEDDFIIGYVGRIMRMKGLDTLLKSCSMIDRKYKLLLVGSGDYKDDLILLARDLGIIDKLILVGAVSAMEVPKYMNCMNVLVLPSITTPGWVEFFGRVLVEAMMCQVPVIGSSSGEIPNVVADAGLIFQEADPFDLKDKLLTIIDNVDLRDELIKKGSARASSLYTWESIAKDTYETYCSLL